MLIAGRRFWVAEDGGSCTAQLGNLLLLGFSRSCEGLVDRALDAPAPGASADDLYGDLYFHTDLSEPIPGDDPLSRLYQSLAGSPREPMSRDDVALSLEGNPKSPGDAENLAGMARGALALAKGQLDEDDEKLQALAESRQGAERGRQAADRSGAAGRAALRPAAPALPGAPRRRRGAALSILGLRAQVVIPASCDAVHASCNSIRFELICGALSLARPFVRRHHPARPGARVR